MRLGKHSLRKVLGAAAPIGVILITFLGLMALPIRSQAATSSIGSVEGQFHASSNGDAVYEVRVSVPPGIRGLEPRLSLRYSSSASNGIVGVGWRLSGLSAIARCPAIPAIDGHRGTLTYSPGDRFCLDGERLIAIEGQAGGDGTTYRTELESWRMVISKGAAGSGPASFEVHHKDGSVWLYGSTTESRILAVGKSEVRAWALSSITDRNFNRLDVTYSSDPGGASGVSGQFYPVRIDYTSNAKASPAVVANRSVVFEYEDRGDIETSYSGGAPITTRYRLSRIETRLEATPVNELALAYGVSQATGRSLLQEIALTGGDGDSSVTLTPTDLTWQGNQQEPPFLSVDTTTGQGPEAHAFLPMDVDGDGRSDFVQAWDSNGSLQLTAYLALATGGFAPAVTTATGQSISFLHLWPADVDGDGRADLIQAWQGSDQTMQFLTYLSQGEGRFATPVASPTKQSSEAIELWTADVNGDGRSDLIQAWQGSDQTLQLLTYLAEDGGKLGAGLNTATGGGVGHLALWPMDVNGDRMIDVVQAWNNSNTLKLVAYLSTGEGFTRGISTSTRSSVVDQGIFPVDANGDGLMDLVQTWSDDDDKLQLLVFMARGDGTFADGINTDTDQESQTLAFWPMDVNGDHKTDFVQGWKDDQNRLHLTFFRAKGGGHYTGGIDMATSGSAEALAFWPGDFDGDGRTDLLQVWTSSRNTLELSTHLPAGAFPDLLAGVSDGFGARYRMTYRPMSDPTVYCPGEHGAETGLTEALSYAHTLTPSVMPMQTVVGGNRHIIAAHTAENDPAKSTASYRYTHGYRYTAARVGHDGRGWLGFATAEQLDESLGKLTITSYHQPFPLTNRVSQVRVSAASDLASTCDALPPPGAVQSVVATDYVRSVTAHGAGPEKHPVELVRPASLRHDLYDGGTYAFSRRTTFDYDGYGNPKLIAKLGKTDSTGRNVSTEDDVYTCLAYDNEVRAWILGFELFRKVSSSPDCLQISTFRPGQDLALSATVWTDDGRYNEASQKQWDDANDSWVTYSYRYDVFGNHTLTVGPEDQSSSITYEKVYNTYPAVVALPEVNGQQLIKRYAFDPRSGLRVGEVDPNGHLRVKCSDALGRIVGFQGPVPVPHRGESPCLTSFATGQEAIVQTPVATLSEITWLKEAGALVKRTRQRATWTTSLDSDFLEQKAYFDGLRRTYRNLRDGEAPSTFVVECREFDAAGRVVRQSLPQDGVTCGSDLWITTDFDLQGRPSRRVHPTGAEGKDSTVTTYAYSAGRITSITRSAGTALSWDEVFEHDYFDGKARITSMSFPGEEGARTTYRYDRLARLLSITDPPTASNPGGVTNAVTYDSLGNILTVTDPDRSVDRQRTALSFTYQNHQLITRTDALGHVTHYSYDALGRRIREVYWDGTERVSHYDGAGKASPNGKGRLTSTSVRRRDGTVESTLVLGYDLEGHEVSRQLTLNGEEEPFILMRTWGPKGQPMGLTYPDGRKLVHGYTRGYLTSLSLEGRPIAAYSDFDVYGHPRRTIHGNGVHETRWYSPTGHPLGHAVETDEGEVLNYKLVWNALDQLTSLNDSAATEGLDRSQSFEYRGQRLIRAQGEKLYGTVSYGYDASGNLVDNGGVRVSYQAHRPTAGTRSGQSVFELTYFGNGALESKTTPHGTWKFELDGRDRLAKVTKDARSVESGILYDHTGRRRLRRTDAVGTTTVYVDPSYQVTRLADGTSETTKVVVGLYGATAAVTLGSDGSDADEHGTPGPGTLHFHRDYLASTLLTTTDDGAVGTQIAYVPYGAPSPGMPQGPDDFRPKFQGKELSGDTGLYFFGARYYDPLTARFISPDSRLGWNHPYRQDAFNRYAFALNNPLTYVDPSGHLSKFWDELISISVGSAEVALGIAAFAIPVDGPVGPMIGSTLIGAGVSGLLYSGQTLATGQSFSWKEWGIQEGVGAIGGAITGGVGCAGAAIAEKVGATTVEVATEEGAEMTAVGSSEIVEDAAASATRMTTSTNVGRILVKGAAGAIAGALVPVATRPFQNWWEGKGFNEHHLSFASIAEGAGFGLAGGLVMGGVSTRGVTYRSMNGGRILTTTRYISRFRSPGGRLIRLIMPLSFNTKKVLYQTGVLPQ